MNFSQQLPSHETFRCCACPGTVSDHFPSFLIFGDLRIHSLNVHMVALEKAVQSSTLLPTTLTMFVCKLCPVQFESHFLDEEQLKIHIFQHSAFFADRWEKFSELQCRVCDEVVGQDTFESHMSAAHSSSLFADISDLVVTQKNIGRNIDDAEEVKSEDTYVFEGDVKTEVEACSFSQRTIRLRPIDLLLDQSKKVLASDDVRQAAKQMTSPANLPQLSLKLNQLALIGIKKCVSVADIKKFFLDSGVLVTKVSALNGSGNVTFAEEKVAKAWNGKVLFINNCHIRLCDKKPMKVEVQENELFANRIPVHVSLDDLYNSFSAEGLDIENIELNSAGQARIYFRNTEDALLWRNKAISLPGGIQIRPFKRIQKTEDFTASLSSEVRQEDRSVSAESHGRKRSSLNGFAGNEERHLKSRYRSRSRETFRSESRSLSISREISKFRYKSRLRETIRSGYRSRSRSREPRNYKYRSSSRIASKLRHGSRSRYSRSKSREPTRRSKSTYGDVFGCGKIIPREGYRSKRGRSKSKERSCRSRTRARSGKSRSRSVGRKEGRKTSSMIKRLVAKDLSSELRMQFDENDQRKLSPGQMGSSSGQRGSSSGQGGD